MATPTHEFLDLEFKGRGRSSVSRTHLVPAD